MILTSTSSNYLVNRTEAEVRKVVSIIVLALIIVTLIVGVYSAYEILIQ